MINILNKVTVGDAFYLQIDGNPLQDATGLNAPLGTIAYTLNGQAYVKVGVNPITGWHPFYISFTQGGNSFGAFPQLILGSIVDKNMIFIRNNVTMINFTTTTDPDYNVNIIRFDSSNFRIRRHIVKDNKRANFSTVFDNTYNPVPVNDIDRLSFVFDSQGTFLTRTRLGRREVQIPTANDQANGDTLVRTRTEVSGSLEGYTYTGATIQIPTKDMEPDNGRIMLCEILVLVLNTGTGEVSQRKKTFTMKATNFALKQYSVIFDADDYSFSENPLEAFSMGLSLTNNPDSIFEQATNTYINTVEIDDLVVGQTYDIFVWQKRYSLRNLD